MKNISKKKAMTMILVAFGAGFLIPNSALICQEDTKENHVANGGFEDPGNKGLPRHWGVMTEDIERISLDENNMTEGKQSLKITKKEYSKEDWRSWASYWFDREPLEPKTKYVLSYSIKIENVEDQTPKGGAGVILHLKKPQAYLFPRLTGTRGWEKVSFEFTTPDQFDEDAHFAINLGIFYATGTAWFDDVSIKKAKLASGNSKLIIP